MKTTNTPRGLYSAPVEAVARLASSLDEATRESLCEYLYTIHHDHENERGRAREACKQ